MVALWSHLNPYFPCSQRVLQDAWKPLAIPVQGLSQLFIARSRQREVSPSLAAAGGGEKAGAVPELTDAGPEHHFHEGHRSQQCHSLMLLSSRSQQQDPMYGAQV